MIEDRREKLGVDSKVLGQLGGQRVGFRGLELDGWGFGGNGQRGGVNVNRGGRVGQDLFTVCFFSLDNGLYCVFFWKGL